MGWIYQLQRGGYKDRPDRRKIDIFPSCHLVALWSFWTDFVRRQGSTQNWDSSIPKYNQAHRTQLFGFHPNPSHEYLRISPAILPNGIDRSHQVFIRKKIEMAQLNTHSTRIISKRHTSSFDSSPIVEDHEAAAGRSWLQPSNHGQTAPIYDVMK